MIKPGFHDETESIFKCTGVHLTDDGQDLANKAGEHHLEAALGSDEFIATYLDSKVAKWAGNVDRLSAIAATHPHAAYAAFVFGLHYD